VFLRGTDCLLNYRKLRFVSTARYKRFACIQRMCLVSRAQYELMAYIQEIGFSVYSAVRADCLYTADWV